MIHAHRLHKRTSHLVDDIWAFTVGPKLPDPFEQRPGLLSVTFIQTDYLPGTVTHYRLGMQKVILGAVGYRRHGGVTGKCGRTRGWRGGSGPIIWPLQKWAVCARVYAWLSGTSFWGWIWPHRGRRLERSSRLHHLLVLDALLPGSVGQGLRCPGWLATLSQDGQEVLYAGGGVGEVEPEGAACYEH